MCRSMEDLHSEMETMQETKVGIYEELQGNQYCKEIEERNEGIGLALTKDEFENALSLGKATDVDPARYDLHSKNQS